MANEINLSVTFTITNGYLKDTFSPGTIQITQTTKGVAGHAQSIGTAAAEIIDIGDIATNGYAILRNIDATNFVTWGPQDSGSGGAMITCGKLKPGEIAVFRLATAVVLMAQADTAAVKLFVRVYED
jgi:hypothetical protein